MGKNRTDFLQQMAIWGWAAGGATLGFAVGFFGTLLFTHMTMTPQQIEFAYGLATMTVSVGCTAGILGLAAAITTVLNLNHSRYQRCILTIGIIGYISVAILGIFIAFLCGKIS